MAQVRPSHAAGGFLSGKSLHITGVVNPPKNCAAIYTSGVLAGVNGSKTYSLTNVVDNYSFITRSL